jgi:2-keto-4-pentenoate hydratase
MLTAEQIDEASTLLVEARRNNAMLDCIPRRCRPQTLREAYAIQDRFIELLGADTRGWFGACTNQAIQKLLDLDEPYYARLLSEHIYQSPATLSTDDYPPMVLECEFGFEVDRDFFPGPDPYSREEIESAVVQVCPTIEVVAGHLNNWPEQDVFSVIADNGTDGALIVGAGNEGWRSIDLTDTVVTLWINGKVKRQGTGANVLGDPFGSFVWLVNALMRDGKSVRAGDIHNTGTATDIYWAKPGDRAHVDFGAIGTVDLELA